MPSCDTSRSVENILGSEAESSLDAERGQVVAMAAPLHYRHCVKVLLKSESSSEAPKSQEEQSPTAEKPTVVVYSKSRERPLDLCPVEWPSFEQADVLERLELMRMAPVVQRRVEPMVIVYSQARGSTAKRSSKGCPLSNVAKCRQQHSTPATLQKGNSQQTRGVTKAGLGSGFVPPTSTERT